MSQEVVMITGAASGIGRALALDLHHNGYQIVSYDRSAIASQENWLHIAGDVREFHELAAGVQQAIDHFGQLNHIITCAGIYHMSPFIDQDPQQWVETISVNLIGSALAVRAALPKMAAGSRVILLGSDQCFRVKDNSSAYAASKGGVYQMARSLAHELAHKQITVNAICPGTVRTPMTESIVQSWAHSEDVEEVWEKIRQEYPLGRLPETTDICHFVRFLLSPAAGYLTGMVVPLEGGLTL